MTQKTVDILLSLKTAPTKGIDALLKEFTELEKKAVNLQKAIDRVGDGKNAGALKAKLAAIKSEMAGIDAQAQKRSLEKALKSAADQAARTKQKMQEIAQVGNKIGLAGAAIVAPFALAMKKYVDTMGETEPTSQKILELSQRWEESQVKLGRVVAEAVLPALEKALDIVDQITAFAEEHPGAIEAALTIGSSLIIIGGLISALASVVSTVATIQGLMAGAGLISGGGAAVAGGTAAAGVGTAAGVGAGAAGLGASIVAGITAAAPFIAIAAAVTLAAELTRQIVNWTMGTDIQWDGIWETFKQLLVIVVEGYKLLGKAIWDGIKGVGKWFTDLQNKINMFINGGVRLIVSGIGSWLSNLGSQLLNGISAFGTDIYNGITSAISNLLSYLPGNAAGGYASKGLYMAGEEGKEFIMSNSTTRAAERMLGGRLDQNSLLAALSGGGSRRITYNDSRRIDSSISARDRRLLRNDVISAISGAL